MPSSWEPFFIDQLTCAHHRAFSFLLNSNVLVKGELRMAITDHTSNYFSLFCGNRSFMFTLSQNFIMNSESASSPSRWHRVSLTSFTKSLFIRPHITAASLLSIELIKSSFAFYISVALPIPPGDP